MNKYLLSVYQPDGGVPPREVLAKIMADVGGLQEEMQAAGAWIFAAGLSPAEEATVVRVREGRATATDGPYVESKEHIGGFTVIQAADLESALEWGRRMARATTLPIEVRPFRQAAPN